MQGQGTVTPLNRIGIGADGNGEAPANGMQ